MSREGRAGVDWPTLAFGGALAVLAGLVAVDMLGVGGAAGYSPVGPTTFPYAVAVFLLGLAVWTIAAAWRGETPEREADDFGPVAWVVGGLLAQLLLFRVAGFSIATGLLFAATARAFGRGPLWRTVPVGIVFSLAVWLLFAKALKLTLPAGPLERLFG